RPPARPRALPRGAGDRPDGDPLPLVPRRRAGDDRHPVSLVDQPAAGLGPEAADREAVVRAVEDEDVVAAARRAPRAAERQAEVGERGDGEGRVQPSRPRLGPRLLPELGRQERRQELERGEREPDDVPLREEAAAGRREERELLEAGEDAPAAAEEPGGEDD